MLCPQTGGTVQPSQPIQRFFRIFESNASSDDVSGAISQFADVFMAASPQGTQAVRATDFALALPKKKQLFGALGCQSTQLVSLRENRLDARYVMASTQWRMTFARPETEPEDVVVDSVFIIDTGGDAVKIVFYLANQDLMQVLKERGIAPQ
jgi:hypothetical protein